VPSVQLNECAHSSTCKHVTSVQLNECAHSSTCAKTVTLTLEHKWNMSANFSKRIPHQVLLALLARTSFSHSEVPIFMFLFHTQTKL